MTYENRKKTQAVFLFISVRHDASGLLAHTLTFSKI